MVCYAADEPRSADLQPRSQRRAESLEPHLRAQALKRGLDVNLRSV